MLMACIAVSCRKVIAPSGMYSATNVGNILFVGFSPSDIGVEIESFYPCRILLVQG